MARDLNAVQLDGFLRNGDNSDSKIGKSISTEVIKINHL